ncbi:MAG: hybrid sensor histidine kinase/response regulator [Odoribacter sp.]
MPIDNSKYTLLLITSSLEEPTKIQQFLRDHSFIIQEATDEQEAIHLATVDTPDLILLDIDRATQQKTAVIRELKSNKTIGPIPVLFITSITNESYIPECLSYDHIDFVTKPFRPQELIIRIQHQLLLLRAERIIRRQNEKLRKTLEARDKLYSVIAHDLRAPIGTIKMINDSIGSQKGHIKDLNIRKLFGMLNQTTEEAFNLLENLLRWTRNQNGKTKIHATEFNLSTSVRQVVSLFSTIAASKEIKIYCDVNGKHCVYADEDMIRTVLRNLLSNAIKFTYPGGTVRIDITDTPKTITVHVKDNGTGIPKNIQPKLLHSEYITTYGTRNEKGSGLGLVLCQDFIKMNRGKLCFTSEEGIGTTFYFTLPASAPLS